MDRLTNLCLNDKDSNLKSHYIFQEEVTFQMLQIVHRSIMAVPCLSKIFSVTVAGKTVVTWGNKVEWKAF